MNNNTPYIKKVTSNKKLRHFTIWTSSGSKYRTYPMSKEEFQSEEYSTDNDWKQFLRSNDYYALK